MKVEVVEKLIRFDDESVFGFIVSAGGQYTVAVTERFGADHDVPDINIAKWFDLPERLVVPVGKDKYAMKDRNIGYFEESANVAVDYMGDRKVYYGHLFDERSIVPMNSEAAWQRMLTEAEGGGFL